MRHETLLRKRNFLYVRLYSSACIPSGGYLSPGISIKLRGERPVGKVVGCTDDATGMGLAFPSDLPFPSPLLSCVGLPYSDIASYWLKFP